MDTLMQPIAMAALLGLVLLAGGVYTLRSRRRLAQPGTNGRRPAQNEELDTVTGWEPAATRVLTHAEREAWHILHKALPEHMVLAQVPLARFIKVPTRNSYSEWLRRAGSLCADLVVCDANAQVVAVVEIRQPVGQGKDKDRALKRHGRLDRVLAAANIPVHVWLEGALPGPAVARETVLGGSVVFTTKSGATLVDTSALIRKRGGEGGVAVDLDVDPSEPQDTDLSTDLGDNLADKPDSDGSSQRMSLWFESVHSGHAPLDQPERVR
jgi:Protein of unknown function (DUF2726)